MLKTHKIALNPDTVQATHPVKPVLTVVRPSVSDSPYHCSVYGHTRDRGASTAIDLGTFAVGRPGRLNACGDNVSVRRLRQKSLKPEDSTEQWL